MTDAVNPDDYESLFRRKCDRVESLYAPFDPPPAARFPSAPLACRMRAEFRIWHEGDDLFYAMSRPGEPKSVLRIDSFPLASERIQAAMPALREQLLPCEALRRKLFQVEFLSTLSGELLVSLIYHRPLGDDWRTAAAALERRLDAAIVGRSRKQKITLSRDYVEEVLPTAAGRFRYRQHEQGFTQPNAGVNCLMIDWACAQAADANGDLLELYCGNGNFTLPLATRYRRVLATEVSRQSIETALHNRAANGADNVEFARLSAREIGQALDGERAFRRLHRLPTALEDYRFGTLFVDPPRAGLDPDTVRLAGRFERVLYISCNPHTQVRDLEQMGKTHKLKALAMFDQFPYTDHMECGALLER